MGLCGLSTAMLCRANPSHTDQMIHNSVRRLVARGWIDNTQPARRTGRRGNSWQLTDRGWEVRNLAAELSTSTLRAVYRRARPDDLFATSFVVAGAGEARLQQHLALTCPTSQQPGPASLNLRKPVAAALPELPSRNTYESHSDT